jgi:PAS domain S-box-containing protein
MGAGLAGAPAAEHCWTQDQVAGMCRGISAILACPDLPAAARQTLSSCRELIGARLASVTLFGDDGAATTVAYRGGAGVARRLVGAPAERSAALRALAGSVGPGYIVNGRQRPAGLPLPLEPGERLASLLVAPMSLKGSTVGLICLADKPGGFAEHDLLVTSAFARLAGVAHQNCLAADALGRSERRLRRSAAQLEASRRTLEQRVARATSRLSRTNAALGRKVAAFEKVRRSLEVERAFRNAVEDSLLTGVVVVDGRARVIHVNRAFCRMVGWSRKALIGSTPPYPFWPPEHAAERMSTFRGIQRGLRPHGAVQARYMRRSGERFDVLIMNSLLRGGAGGLVASVADVTRQLATEAALRETATRLQQISAKLLSAEERERKRISRELHDSLGQTLSALKYRLEEAVAASGAEARAHEVRQRLVGAAHVLSGAIEEVRAIVLDLRPSILDDLGLISAVRWLGREFGRRHPGTGVAVRVGVEERDVPEELKIVLFRLLQEALNNVSKHSRAGRVAIRLSGAGGRLALSVRDNGRGFTPGAVSSGVGLLSMRERTELSGGVFAVVSAPGNGAAVRATWPLPQPPRRRG